MVEKIELKKIKVRYGGNECSMCNREMQIGWTAYFNPANKALICVPCAKTIEHSEAIEKGKEDDAVSPQQFDMLFDMLGKNGDSVTVLNQQVNDMDKKLDTLIDKLSSLFAERFSVIEKPLEEKKETRKATKRKPRK